MDHNVVPEEVHSLAQRGMFGLAQIGITLPEFSGKRAREFDEFRVAQVGDAQFGHSALAHTDEIAGATQLKIGLGQFEAIVG